MSDNKNINIAPEKGQLDSVDPNIAASAEVSSVSGSVKTTKTTSRVSSSSERQIKYERAQKCLENAALVSKRIKEHRKATAELLGRTFEEDDGGDTASEITSTMSERTGYSAITDTSTAMSVQDALNIPGISETLANTLKQKESLIERIKQYKEISKRPPSKSSSLARKDSTTESKIDLRKSTDNNEQLINTLKEKVNTISVINVKMKAMEATILDLQEKINEKDQIIEAKNRATTLMSDNLSKKEKDSMALLEDTRLQMSKMQENFVTMEAEWKAEKQKLKSDIEIKNEKIKSLEEANSILETSRFEISMENSKLLEELDLKGQEITRLELQIKSLSQQLDDKPSEKEKDDHEEEKGSKEIADMTELTKKVELLEQLNCQIRQTNKELENKLTSMSTEPKAPGGSPSKKGSPLPSRKGGRKTAAKSPWSQLSSESLPQETDKKHNKNEMARLEMLVQSLNKEILDKEYTISQKDEQISDLQSSVSEQQPIEASRDLVDVGVGTDLEIQINLSQAELEHPVSSETPLAPTDILTLDLDELQQKLRESQTQISDLNIEIDAANKNMIKVKSTHKLKLKQMQKTIDNFSKVSDTNTELVRLNEEIHQLTQKVAELEEEKGNLQLHLVDYDSGRLTETDVYKKLLDVENLAETRLKAISVLETQKFDLVQELHILQQKYIEMEDKFADITQLQSEQVSTEIKSVQLEEQIDALTASKKELELIIENLKLDKDHLNSTIKELLEEKEELNHKLESYMQENMDLTDKLEKLSAEKVSSAESIEIVESLTTQEKLELEEYNKGIAGDGMSVHESENISTQNEKSIDNLIEQREELNRKIELFTQEREEVMEKMSKITSENESLQQIIVQLREECASFQSSVEGCSKELNNLQCLNQELSRQIEELKRERLDVAKDTVEISRPVSEESADTAMSESQHEDKAAGEKGMNRTKSVKQLTKEILKLKNTIKEREAEIGDCQMKILSLEEQQQKQNEILHANSSIENKIKILTDENNHLKEELDQIKKYKDSEQQAMQYKQASERLQQDIHNLQQEYASSISARDNRIKDLETVLVEYEKQIYNYGNTLQQKDQDLTEYMNQITKLNDVSQKLKSTIELLEEEKAKDQNVELIKGLNKQIAAFQKKITDNEEKIRILEDDKSQLTSLKLSLESQNGKLDAELRGLHETLVEKQNLIKELQGLQQKHSEDLATVKMETKERDEEMHEIKLQLRKESIENEKLRNTVDDKELLVQELSNKLKDETDKLNVLILEKENWSSQFTSIETKNKELMEKLKKFAINIKKKSTMYTDLENQLIETQKELESKKAHIEQLLIQVDTLPALQEKVKYADEEINRLHSQKVTIDQQKIQDIRTLQEQIKNLEEHIVMSSDEVTKLNDTISILHNDLQFAHEENTNLKSKIDSLNKTVVEFEIEQRNNMTLAEKYSSLEAELNQKQNYVTELLQKLEVYEHQETQAQFGHEAKIQERDLYIENLETEINKHKNRICRLEESISVMEGRRKSLERKADQLGIQLQEKQKSYVEYSNQEDELVGRLAVLMDHDRVVERQLHEIENENKELQHKIQQTSEENQRLRKSLSDIQEHCITLNDKASKADLVETELSKCQTRLTELESHLKRTTNEHQLLIAQKKKEIEELEIEFNTQIENAFKEKKTLSEKYEKTTEHLNQIELKLHEYQSSNENLTLSLQELNRVNQELMDKITVTNNSTPQDYTDQYISEINNLNAVINSKNQEITDLTHRVQSLQSNNLSNISNLESKITELANKLQHTLVEFDAAVKENNDLKQTANHLQSCLAEKDNYIKELKDNRTLSFEMNIPKTEGLLISSTIEPMSQEQGGIDFSSLDSQIVTEADISQPTKKVQVKGTEALQKKSVPSVSGEQAVEPAMVAKKAYECFTGEADLPDIDPFNSDEGWGLGESEEVANVTHELSYLNEQLQTITTEKNKLKSDLEASNIKLLKALKKLKELKAANEVISNELRTSKQVAQSSFLDSAIEDELQLKIIELEKKVEELNSDLTKEKREKASLRKQNEVFNNANDKLTEMKEKLDNEIELWKYKFKEVNDKLSTVQWSDTKDSPRHEPVVPVTNTSDSKVDKLHDNIIKLERENDELQQTIDELTSQNNELLIKQKQVTTEIENMNNQLALKEQCKSCESLKMEITDLQNENLNLQGTIDRLKSQVHDIEDLYKDITQKYDAVKTDNTKLQDENKKLQEISIQLETELELLKESETKNVENISILCSELNNLKSKSTNNEPVNARQSEVEMLTQKCDSLDKECENLKHQLEEATKRVHLLETSNTELVQQSESYSNQINELNTKLLNLNTENDSLLSTVAELRSSVASAIDQRGYEIAELWKQHLAQRESDFQKLETDLRNQVTASEAKYDQLLDTVQSSSQEETNRLVIIEQVNSLQVKLNDKEEHLRVLQDKYSETINELDMLRSEMQDEKVTNENRILEQQEEYEKIIKEYDAKLKENSSNYEQSLKTLQTELDASKINCEEFSKQIEQLNTQLSESEDNIQQLRSQFMLKDNEVYQKINEYTIALSQRNEEFEKVREKLVNYEKKIEELTYEKESELAVLRLKMHENSTYFEKLQGELEKDKNDLTEELKERIVECTNLNKQVADLNKTLEEYANQTSEMQAALENQEIELVTLKDEITNLEGILRSSTSKIQKHVSFSSDTKLASDESASEEVTSELLDAVPRAELDLALYMLHQRDVRCEELTMELTQLLEERDTLQLRLSDSLRMTEELKTKYHEVGSKEITDSAQETISELPSFSVEREQQFVDVHRGQGSRSSSVSELDGEKPKLQAKLSELRSVRHSRDVRLRQESEQRQWDMRLLQRDVANLPPEALDQLTQAHHTLSRDSQSTSTVLLNWLRGKSTPKVVDM